MEMGMFEMRECMLERGKQGENDNEELVGLTIVRFKNINVPICFITLFLGFWSCYLASTLAFVTLGWVITKKLPSSMPCRVSSATLSGVMPSD
jgi:hypothetical protein